MYIQSIHIENIRSIESLNMKFEEGDYAGWHVILGDNGAGKSTLIRAIALALIGTSDAQALRQDWSSWLRRGTKKGEIDISISRNPYHDRFFDSTAQLAQKALIIQVEKKESTVGLKSPDDVIKPDEENVLGKIAEANWRDNPGWYAAAFGPFRRFSGGNEEMEKLLKSRFRVANFLTAFGEDVALSEAIAWLQRLHYQKLDKKLKGSEAHILDHLKLFINQSGLLPQGTQLDRIDSDGVFFIDGEGQKVLVDELSDGFRSILSMAFEIIRQLVHSYGADVVFKEFSPKSNPIIKVPGVIMIDEVDAHLHPTWQTRIGDWFTRYFPSMQFIVTTHSPLICRGAAERGSIWRLPAPGSGEQVREVKGDEKNKLIFGNVLEAYSTDAFGEQTARGAQSQELLEKLSHLNKKAAFGKLNAGEAREQAELQKIFTSDDTLKL